MANLEPYRAASSSLQTTANTNALAAPLDLGFIEKFKARRNLSKFQEERLKDLLSFATATQRQDLVLRLNNDTMDLMTEAAYALETKIAALSGLPDERRNQMELTLIEHFNRAYSKVLALQLRAEDTMS